MDAQGEAQCRQGGEIKNWQNFVDVFYDAPKTGSKLKHLGKRIASTSKFNLEGHY